LGGRPSALQEIEHFTREGFLALFGEELLVELFKQAGATITGFVVRAREAGDRRWDRVFIVLEMLQEVSKLHVDAINQVVLPITQDGDIARTVQLYEELVYDQTFPKGYADAKGFLKEASSFKPFKGSQPDTPLKAVLDELHKFQTVAFALENNSWDISETFGAARELWSLLLEDGNDARIAELRSTLSQDFPKGFTRIQMLEELPDHVLFRRPDDVVDIVRQWCTGWRRKVHETLYGGHGLDYAIGRLKAERYK
jgi:hypothetical protein